MTGFDSYSAGLYGLLYNRGRVQKVLNYRKAIGAAKCSRKCTMVRAMGLAAWEELLLEYAGCSDKQLEANIQLIDKELEMRLERKFIFR